MALIMNTNAGFVSVAPTSDPGGVFESSIDTSEFAFRDMSPVGASKIIEIGWFCPTATEETNFEVGIYDHDSGNNRPDNLLSGASQTNAKGTSSGWKVATGLDITISASTIYWLAIQVDDTATQTSLDQSGTGTGERGVKHTGGKTTLTDPWGATGSTSSRISAIYALVETAAPTGVTRKIKIAGTFIDKPILTKVGGTFVDKPIKIKVGGTFQDA